ncbi:transcriptional regulator [Paenibacillus oryzae]|jgi:XRE family transcriptional regulator of biofilm formation|uniref:Transcriptional regulator n=1 Tax=Paenibacillus oryzae TaxID=1844972 RepID=A0A1A5YBZ7_9BACL|nr:helix-turn-helix domain-containing protein [Paenibacillus oryzae]OBR62925.1 transcriptional regulator [Paenibacillus oryzae]
MIGERIQMFRKRRGLSLTELSQRAGVAKSYLSSIERGLQQNPSIQFLEKIGEVLHVPVEEFVNSEQQDRPAGELDREWEDIVREAMKSGVSKEQFKEFLEFNKWKSNRE